MNINTNSGQVNLASISRTLSEIADSTKRLIREAGGLPSIHQDNHGHSVRRTLGRKTLKVRRLSDVERARALIYLDAGWPVARVAKKIKTTRMTCYTLLRRERPGFRQRVFHVELPGHQSHSSRSKAHA